MKHLKLFENAGTEITITTVRFDSGEYVLGCYVDGELEFYGDYYHDKIQEKIEGFILGLKWLKENWAYPLTVKEEDTIYCNNSELNDEICQMAGSPPKKLSEIN